MKIAVFGGTGGTGLQFVSQAIEAGHSLKVLARSPAKLVITSYNLTIIKGDGLNEEDVEKTIEGQESVFVTIGTREENVHEKVQQNVNRAMKKFGVKRLVIVTSMGVGEQYHNVGFVFKIVRWLFLEKAFLDKDIQERLVRESGLDYTIVRPSGLNNGPNVGGYKEDPENNIFPGYISRSDVADFCLRCITDQNSSYLNKTVSITF